MCIRINFSFPVYFFIKQDAILCALRFLDTYYSYLDYSSGIIPERDTTYNATKLTLECRDCYERLCISVKNREVLEVFLSIIMSPSPSVAALNSRMKNSINDFISKGCEIIVCACRTWGETTNEIESLKKQGFDVIWTQNDRTDNAALHKALNKLYAEQIETVINLHINNSNNIK